MKISYANEFKMNSLTTFCFTLFIYISIQQITCDNSPTFHDLTNIPINDDHDVNSTNLTKDTSKSNEPIASNTTSIPFFDLSNHVTVDNSTNQTSHQSIHNSPTHITPSSSSTNQHQSASKCELITLPMCKGIGYNHTKMPNQLNHDTQEEAGLEGFFEKNKVEIKCSEDLQLFLCLIYAPVCMDDYSGFVPPCRSTCERAKSGCEPVLQNYKFQWPKPMNCDKFPEHSKDTLCIDKKIQGNNLNAGNENIEMENSIFNLGNIPIIEDKSNVDEDHFNKDNKKSSISGTVFDIFSENTDDDQEHTVTTNKKRTKNKQRTKSNTKSVHKSDDFSNHYPDTGIKQNDNLIPPNCKCECRRPFLPINHLNDKRYFNQIITGEVMNCAIPCNSPYFSRTEQKAITFWITLFSIVCSICTLITLLTFIADSERFHYPEKCIIFLSTCYLMVSAGFLIRTYVGHESVACDVLTSQTTKEALNLNRRIAQDDSIRDLDESSLADNFLTLIRYENTGQIPGNCLVIFWLIYYFSMCASVWWVLLTFTWFLASGLKWSNEAIDSYSQYFHLIAWFVPAIKSIIIISIGAIDGDPLTGICYVGNLNDLNLLIFVIVPLCVYLVIGCLFLFSGFVSLFRIRAVLRQQTRNKTDKLEKLMVRIVIFSVLYILPSIIITMCNIYEYQNRQSWALNHNCQCKSSKSPFYVGLMDDSSGVRIKHFTNESPMFIVFFIKYVMCLVVGIASTFWMYSSKTVNSWIRFYGRFCCYYCCGLCKPEKKFNNRETFERQSNNNMSAQLMSNISYGNPQQPQQSNYNSQLLASNNQLMSSSSQFTSNNSNRAYKQLLNHQQQQQFGAHLGLKSLSSNGSSSTSHCKLPLNLSHV